MDRPDLANVEPTVRDALARGMTSMSAIVQDLYSISLIDVSAGYPTVLKNEHALSVGPSSENGDNLTPSYAFRLPPKVHEMSEPFDTNIIGTQDGGKYVESHGSPIKDIRLSGTTGLRPHRNATKNLKIFGADTGLSASKSATAQAVEFAGLSSTPDAAGPLASLLGSKSAWAPGEAIGHDDIIFLRNLFRLYEWHRVYGPNAGRVLMVWRNLKDADYWIVEPVEFRLAQSSSSPLTYEYSISLKTLQKFKVAAYLEEDDSFATLRSARNFVSRANQASAAIRNSMLVIASQMDRVARAPRDVSTAILRPMRDALEGLSAIRRSENRFSSVLRQSLTQARDNLFAFANEVQELGLPAQDILVNSMRKAGRAADRILSDPEMQPSSQDSITKNNNNQVLDAYNTPTENKGAYTGIPSLTNARTVSQALVQVGDNIHSLSLRLLGDRLAYRTLVTMNSLSAPYVSPAGGPGVLRPGDYVLYPSTTQSAPDFGVIANANKSTAEMTGQAPDSSVSQQYGRDLRLKASQSSAYEVQYDIDLDQNGDISTIVGIPNVAQAVRTKFSTIRGQLPAHPSFGAAFPMGSKATPKTLAGFRLDVEQTLLSDPRIDNIKNLKFVAVGDTVSASATINLSKSTTPVKLAFPLRTI